MTTPRYRTFPTAFGTCGIAWSDAGLLRVQLAEETTSATEARLRRTGAVPCEGPAPHWVDECVALIARHLDGEPSDYRHLPLDERGLTDTQRAIYGALREVGWGTTTTYGVLARATRSPGDARVVGQAMARNPWPVVVPCHRVLAVNNAPGGFSAPGGVSTKLRLLALEGVPLPERASSQRDLFDSTAD